MAIVGRTLEYRLDLGIDVDAATGVGDSITWETSNAIRLAASAQLNKLSASWNEAVTKLEGSLTGRSWFSILSGTSPITFSGDGDAQEGDIADPVCVRFLRFGVTTGATSGNPLVDVAVHIHEEV